MFMKIIFYKLPMKIGLTFVFAHVYQKKLFTRVRRRQSFASHEIFNMFSIVLVQVVLIQNFKVKGKNLHKSSKSTSPTGETSLTGTLSASSETSDPLKECVR